MSTTWDQASVQVPDTKSSDGWQESDGWHIVTNVDHPGERRVPEADGRFMSGTLPDHALYISPFG